MYVLIKIIIFSTILVNCSLGGWILCQGICSQRESITVHERICQGRNAVDFLAVGMNGSQHEGQNNRYQLPREQKSFVFSYVIGLCLLAFISCFAVSTQCCC